MEARSQSLRNHQAKKQCTDASAPDDSFQDDPSLDWALEPSLEDQEAIKEDSCAFHHPGVAQPSELSVSPSAPLGLSLEEEATNLNGLFNSPYPYPAGTSLGLGQTPFDQYQQFSRKVNGISQFGPFVDKEEWELT